MRNLIKLFSTGFFIGYFPIAPGTAGSLLGVLIFFLFAGTTIGYLSITLLITFIGFMVSGRAEVLFNKKDPSCVVIDEIAGMCITFIGIKMQWQFLVLGFLFFRFFDIVKFWPMNKIEKFDGSVGIMCDDIAAGILANMLLQVVVRLPF